MVEALSKESAEYKRQAPSHARRNENLRRRTVREIADTRLYGISAFARDIIAVADNCSARCGRTRWELREKADAGTKALLDGVEPDLSRELLKVLEKHGVKKFDPLGEKFDPDLTRRCTTFRSVAAGGHLSPRWCPRYMIGERLLRPALVAVSKGGGGAGLTRGARGARGGRRLPAPLYRLHQTEHQKRRPLS